MDSGNDGAGYYACVTSPHCIKNDRSRTKHFLKTIREGVEKTVKGLPMHHDYVKQYCGVKEIA